jgi:2-iminobutanoate/2-iminopropanoate deaminase
VVSGPGKTVYVSGNISPRGSLAHVVRVTAWLTSLDEYGEYNRVRGERFGTNLPASAAVQVAGLLRGALIEIDAVAFIPD